MVASGELKAPIDIGRDNLDSGSVASPNRENGSDEGRLGRRLRPGPMLNALLNCASGATWVSLHHGGGVGMGFSQHAGMVIVCDGTAEATRGASSGSCGNDPASGVMRHADAGYESGDRLRAGKGPRICPAWRCPAALRFQSKRHGGLEWCRTMNRYTFAAALALAFAAHVKPANAASNDSTEVRRPRRRR